MGLTKRRESSPSSQTGGEASLPLYEEFQISETENDNLPLPPLTATPNEVRDYLTSLLKNKHSLPDDHVRRVVACWTIGTGRELRSYTPRMYLSIFGREDGWTLYRDIKLEIYQQPQRKTFFERRGIYIFPAISCSLMLLIIMLRPRNGVIITTVQTAAAICFGPVALACVASLGILIAYECFSLPTPEQRIESDLQVCTTRREGLQ